LLRKIVAEWVVSHVTWALRHRVDKYLLCKRKV
jgi:hypothetical protein